MRHEARLRQACQLADTFAAIDQACRCVFRFHEVLPLIGFENLTQSQACQQTIHGDPNSIPYPLLNENTFVISSSMVLNHAADREHPRLQFRVG